MSTNRMFEKLEVTIQNRVRTQIEAKDQELIQRKKPEQSDELIRQGYYSPNAFNQSDNISTSEERLDLPKYKF